MKKLLLISFTAITLLISIGSNIFAASSTGTTFTVEKLSGSEIVAPNGVIAYSITIKNNATTNSSPTSIKDTLPDGFKYNGNAKLTTVSGTQVDFAPTISGQVLTWTFDGDTLQSIPQNQQIVISYQTTASSTLGAHNNTACLIAPEEVCATETVTVAVAPSAGIVESTLMILAVGILLIAIALKLNKNSTSFEKEVLSR